MDARKNYGSLEGLDAIVASDKQTTRVNSAGSGKVSHVVQQSIDSLLCSIRRLLGGRILCYCVELEV
jgi:hypothetical protein